MSVRSAIIRTPENHEFISSQQLAGLNMQKHFIWVLSGKIRIAGLIIIINY
jgi:hypothetical protein